MPVFTVNTNVALASVPADFKKKATDVISKSLSKPASYIAIHVVAGQDISFGGTSEPAALCSLTSIGALSVTSNKKHSKALMELIEKELKVSPDRTYITFDNKDKADIGFQSTTFHDLI